MEDTQSVGSSTWVITPRHSILSRCSLTFGCKAMGHFLGACITGCASWQSWILYSLGNWPMPLNQSGNSLIKSSVDLMGLAASGAVAGLLVAAVVGTGAGWVQGCLTGDGTSSSSQLQVSHLRVDPGWRDQGCLQHTNMILPCGGEHQGNLVAKWWVHGVHHIGVYGIHCMQWVWYWHGLGQWVGQLDWSDLGIGIKTHRGVTHCLQLQYRPWHAEWGCSLSTGTFRQLYGGVCLIALWGTDISNHDFFGVSVSGLSCWVGCSVGLFHLEGCGPHWHLWHVSCSATLGSGCGS